MKNERKKDSNKGPSGMNVREHHGRQKKGWERKHMTGCEWERT